MEDIKESMAQLTSIFHQKFADFEHRQQQITSPSPLDASSLAAEFASFKAFTLHALRTLQTQVEMLARESDNLEMYNRRKILLLHGIPEDKKEDTEAAIVKVVVQKLKLCDFGLEHITRCHRMGRVSTSDRPRPILFKVRDMSLRSKVWAAKTSLKGTGITMSEFLTKSRHDIFMSARQRFGVSKCWTRDGHVYVLGAGGERHRVISIADLDGLALQPVAAVAAPKKPAAATKDATVAAKPRRAAAASKK